MYTIYALQFKNKYLYIGMTSDLDKRIKDHATGRTKSTKNKKIIKVFKIEECLTRIEARAREKYWKSGCGKEFLKLKIRAISSVG